MNNITSTLICVLVGIGISSVVLGVIDLISNIKRHRSLVRYNRNNKRILTDEENESHINQNLIVIRDNHSPVEQANAFISLMELRYILVNVISNEGNKYCDDNQLKSAREALKNKRILSKFSELEGHYE